MRTLSFSSNAAFLSPLLATLVGCSSPPPAEGPKPVMAAPAPAPAPAQESKPGPAPLPTFSPAQQEQLDLLGAVCTTAYHLDASGQVDQIGCSGSEPSKAPVAAEKLSSYGQSWRGHFVTATSDDLLVWFTSGEFMLFSPKDGKPTTLTTRYAVGEAECVKLSGPDAPDALACKGSFPGVGHSVPDLLKLFTFGPHTRKDSQPFLMPVQLFSAHSAENLWDGLCSDSLSVAYFVRSIASEKNAETGADDLKIEIERQGWLSKEMAAAKKKKESAEICKRLDEAMTEGSEPPALPAAPSKMFSVVLPFGTQETPDLMKIQDEASDEMAQADERGRAMGLVR